MPDRISLILDSMIAAVDEGFSFDGIVSIPETGLETVGYRTGLAGLFDDSVDLFRTLKGAVSKRRTATPPVVPPQDASDHPSLRDSGIEPPTDKPPTPKGSQESVRPQPEPSPVQETETESMSEESSRLVSATPLPPTQSNDERQPRKNEQVPEDDHEKTPGSPFSAADQSPKLPRKKSGQLLEDEDHEKTPGSPSSVADQSSRLPRKKSGQLSEDTEQPTGPGSPVPEDTEAVDLIEFDQSSTQGQGRPRPADKLPRKGINETKQPRKKDDDR